MHALAFSSATGWTVVTWNEGRSAATYGLQLPTSVTAKTAAITNASKSLVRNGASPKLTDSGSWLVQLPARTIVTYTFSKQAATP